MESENTENVIGVLAFTNKSTLEHKLEDGKRSEHRWCEWDMSRFPKRISKALDEDPKVRLYLAVKGKVRGYFQVHDFGGFEYFMTEKKGPISGSLQFHSESWQQIDDGEILKPSQGWRYYLHE